MDLTLTDGTRGFLSEFVLVKDILKSPIKVFQLIPTEDCGFGCSSCNSQNGRGKKIELAHAKDVLRHASELGAKYTSITGPGEPLEHPEIVEMVNFAFRMGLDVVINTNAQNLNIDFAEYLASSGLFRMDISYHNQSNWKEIVDVMKTMRKPRNARIPRMIPVVNYLLESDRSEEAVEIARSVIDVGAFFHMLLPTYNNGSFSSGNAARKPSKEDIRNAVTGLNNLGWRANSFFIVTNYDGSSDLAKSYSNGFHCNPGGSSFVCVGPEGLVHPCQEWRDVGVDFLRIKTLDDLKVNSIEDLVKKQDVYNKIYLPRKECWGCYYNCYIISQYGANWRNLAKYIGIGLNCLKII